ncbi:hypothetical protein [Rubrivivax gelatinosus]|uniref:hypothetical protein n=1 Tax=Rubrivivax gelatinosus TaxID=28068 RepID=UPI0005C1FDCB|nr:hypothetical protein [Rubrivivax gelatinosus]MBG6083125.1 hypothetical protein [Rubrivivax gelatinosus]
MSIFPDTLSAFQQLDLLGTVPEQSSALLRPLRAFLCRQVEEIMESGHRAEVVDLGSAEVALVLQLIGVQGRPRDRYQLRLWLDGAVVTCQFLGPSPKAVALTLSTRHVSDETLRRWAATFYEWALTVREDR